MKKFLIVSFFAIISVTSVHAQKLSPAEVQKMVEEKHFTFEPQSMTPASGEIKQLSSGYLLKISADSLVSYLPFMGRAYIAPVYGSGGGYDFTTTDFKYEYTALKKGSFQVNITSNDKSQTAHFLFTIFDNGKAYLQLTSTNRENISYNGYITE